MTGGNDIAKTEECSNCSDYDYLKGLRKDLLAINIAECTPQEAIGHLRNLQIKCLAHMTI